MARDTGLEELVSDELRAVPGITEKGMFGGELPGIAPMRSGTRRMHGWVRAEANVYGNDSLRRKLIARAIEFVRSLPEK